MVAIPLGGAVLFLSTACERTDLTLAEYPCLLDFVPTGVALRSDLEGTTPDPTERIARGPDGRFYTDVDAPGEIAVWSADGTFLHTIGRSGEGPGEMGPYMHTPIVDGQGTLHVFDTQMGAWHRFTSEGTFVGRTGSRNFRFAWWPYLAVITGDSVLTSVGRYVSDRQYEIITGEGTTTGFGDPPDDLGVDVSPMRAVAHPGGSTFWAAPLDGGLPDGYVLEEWTLGGELVRTIRRDVSWFPVGMAGGESEAGLPRVDFPKVMLSAGASAHLLSFVILSFPPDPSLPPEGNASRSSEAGELWYEVIDTETSEVLASRQVHLEGPGLDDIPFWSVFPGTPSGIRPSTDELGLTTIEIIDYTLEPHPDATEAQARVCVVAG